MKAKRVHYNIIPQHSSLPLRDGTVASSFNKEYAYGLSQTITHSIHSLVGPSERTRWAVLTVGQILGSPKIWPTYVFVMTTPAVLYDHVPVVEKDNTAAPRTVYDDGHIHQQAPSLLALRSYFVTKIVHQVSAPPEDTDESRYPCQQQQQQEEEEEEKEMTDTQQATLKKKEKSESESDCDSICVSTPMETIWEDNVYTDYVFVPHSAMSEDHVVHSQHSARRKLSYSRLQKLQYVIRSLFSHKPLADTPDNNHRPSIQDGEIRSITINTAFLDPLVRASSYFFSYLPTARPSTSIFKTYDWVSETTIDKSGNRLILPGALVVMDASQGDLTGLENSSAAGILILPSVQEGTKATSVGDARREPSFHTKSKSFEGSSSLSWWPSSTTVMVSAHDLLAVQRQRRKVDAAYLNGRSDLISSPTNSSLWIVPEENENLESMTKTRPFQTPGQQTVALPNTETTIVLQTWTSALWKSAKRRTKRWCHLNYCRVQMKAKQVGRGFLFRSSLPASFESVVVERPGTRNNNDNNPLDNIIAGRDCEDASTSNKETEDDLDDHIQGDVNMIEMTTLN
ncbi:hypothetical protein IV203_008790 [Nitzschia inconspicua]|uniref:Uncharacterized protein n=1 Tax=Nitzschia inconspicua TaxID=303405 RepID=A0A9K3KZP5_9STRA|nr:hypothetical protein IV203_008790 [Nitzschia inconspicua]